MTNNNKQQAIRLTANLSTETLQARKEWHHLCKMMKRKKQKPYNQESSTQDGSPSDLTEKSKFYRQTKD